MTPIAAIYENGVFRPLSLIELPEGSRVEMLVLETESYSTENHSGTETNGPLVGEELIALLDQIAALPYTPHSDGRTDISANHDEFLYPKDGKTP